MNECIICYDGLSHYNDPEFVTKTILLAKHEHTKRNDFFNLNWYQKIILWGIVIIEIHAVPSFQNVFDKLNLIPPRIPSRALIPSIEKLKSVSARKTTKQVTNGLSPVKIAKGKHFSLSLE